MKLGDAISRLDELRPNGFSREQKMFWLTTLDSTVKKEIIDRHEGAEKVNFVPYDEKSADETELLISAPYDEIYLRYLEAQIDYANGEYDRFNNSNSMYAAAYTAFARAYNRAHLPLTGSRKYY